MPVSKIPGAGISGGSVVVNQTAPDNSLVVDSSGNVGIGTSSPSANGRLTLSSAGSSNYQTIIAGSNTSLVGTDSSGLALSALGANNIVCYTVGTERMRIDSSGNLLIRTTANFAAAPTGIGIEYTPAVNYGIAIKGINTSTGTAIIFLNPSNTQVGAIQTSNTGTSYVTTSDYRLKENIAPMTGALATVQALKPVTYKWKADGSDGQGFIAHELAEVVPEAVSGEKDAVETYTDEEGNEQTRIKPQGIDTSFLVATLTAAIQELNAKVEAQAARIAELEGAQ